MQDKLNQRLKIDDQDQLDKLIAEAYFKKKTNLEDVDPDHEPNLREKVDATGIRPKNK